MSRITKYLVESIGGVGSSGKPDSQWFVLAKDARDEVKRRLGLVRLHEGKRLHAREWLRADLNRTHEGYQWRCVSLTYYERVPPSHPEHGRKGGIRVHAMDRESPTFDPSSLKFG